MTDRMALVHVTHEAVAKVGGIGAVLHGFFTSKAYIETVDRSIVVGPLFTHEGSLHERLGENATVLYSSIDRYSDTQYASAFRQIEYDYGVGIIYGNRKFTDPQTGTESYPEALVLDVHRANPGPVNNFKRILFQQFGIPSNRYEHIWEYEQYVRLAPAALAALRAIGAEDENTVVVAHEYMGIPTALAAIADPHCPMKTAFHAHEVATMRPIVEKHPGHDTMFYNVLRQANMNGLYVEEIFGDQNGYFKHPLVDASKHCNTILAVGDYVAEELRFMGPEFTSTDINLVYNGIPAYDISIEEKLESKRKLRQYCNNLLGYEPDIIFTHVTRLVRSKGLWRDLRVLEHLEKKFQKTGRTAVYYLLSTEVAQRRSSDIERMESIYDWPVAHREGWPDLSGGEANFYTAVQQFNARSKNIKMVFINQFGFSRRHCGERMPADVQFMDIRKGSDVEFGQSIYEPFGIAQLEPLTFGGICVLTNVCGCCGFINDTLAAERIAGLKVIENIIIADYTALPEPVSRNIKELLTMDRPTRNEVEETQAKDIAEQILLRLPKNNREIRKFIESGYRIARNMSWDVVVTRQLLPSLKQMLYRQPSAV